MLPSGPQFGVKYVLTGPDGTRIAFNDKTDPDYVGALTNISGFDSAEVRENADDLVQMDGGIHGDFFYGRRPITLEGLVYGFGATAVRQEILAKVQQATNAMRADATLEWTVDGGIPQYLKLRRAQPLRIEGGFNKAVQIAMVAADPRIYSVDARVASVNADFVPVAIGRPYPRSYDKDYGDAAPSGQLIIANQGNAETFPIYTVLGPGTSPQVINFTTGKIVSLLYTLAAGEGLLIDTLNRTVQFGVESTVTPGTLNPTTLSNKYSALDFLNTEWGGLAPGSNDLRLAFFSYTAGAKLRVDWRDAWL